MTIYRFVMLLCDSGDSPTCMDESDSGANLFDVRRKAEQAGWVHVPTRTRGRGRDICPRCKPYLTKEKTD